MSRYVVKSEIDDLEFEEDEQTEVKQERAQTSQNIALECAPPELEQKHNPLVIDQTSLEAMLDPTDDPALTDCQPPLTSVINKLFGISEESIKEQEVAPNSDLGHLTSTNVYPGAVSSATMDNGCEINTTDHFHGGSEVQASDVGRATMTTDQSSDIGITRTSQQHEIPTAVNSNASNDITATATPVSIPAETPPLKRAKVPNKQIGPRVSKPPIAPQEPLPDDEMPLRLRLRDRKQINYCEGDSKSRAHNSKKESKAIGNFKPKVRPQFKKKCQISHLRASVVPKRAVDGEKRYKCKVCQYATNHKRDFTDHMHTHTGEKPYKCRICEYATAHSSHLIRHNRIHTGEKPHKCQSCEYATAYSCALNTHMRTKHKNAQQVPATNSKKNAERNLLKKSGNKD